MELDTKQKVLLAIYTEYQKDIPDMVKAINSESLGIPQQALYIALDKLENEGFIKGLHILHADNGIYNVLVQNTKMTRDGIEFIERKFEIDPVLSGPEKLQSIMKKAIEWGWEQYKDICARTLAEFIKSVAR